jgi:hypothetical protein
MRKGARGVLCGIALAIALCAAVSDEAQAALLCDGKAVTIKGSNGADVLKGTAKPDVIAGRGGADTIKGRGGDDKVCGGDGPDRLLGQAGYDRLLDDSAETDTLVGGADLDVCSRSNEDTVDCDFGTEDPVIFVPHKKAPTPNSLDIAAAADLVRVDVYAILDRSGSMSAETSSIKNNFATVLNSLRCQPLGSGLPGQCVPDLWAGAGTVGFAGSGDEAFQNVADVQPSPSVGNALTTEPDGCCNEPLTYSVHAAITGQGGASFGMPSVPPRSTCGGSPASNGGFAPYGYPCFREGALPVIVLATDETPLSGTSTHQLPNWASVVKPAMNAAGARLVGLLGDSPVSGTETELGTMATDTGAVDAGNGNAPLVFQGAGANAATALANGLRALIEGLPLDVEAVAKDDPADSVDAVAAFVDHIEVTPSGAAQCSADFSSSDTNGDAFSDTYSDVLPGTPLCWKVVAKRNLTVPATSEPQILRATVDVISDGRFRVDQFEVTFVVPAAG